MQTPGKIRYSHNYSLVPSKRTSTGAAGRASPKHHPHSAVAVAVLPVPSAPFQGAPRGCSSHSSPCPIRAPRCRDSPVTRAPCNIHAPCTAREEQHSSRGDPSNLALIQHTSPSSLQRNKAVGSHCNTPTACTGSSCHITAGSRHRGDPGEGTRTFFSHPTHSLPDLQCSLLPQHAPHPLISQMYSQLLY